MDTPFVISKGNAAARVKIQQIYLDNRDVFESGFPIYLQWRPAKPPTGQPLSQISADVPVIRGDSDSPVYMMASDNLASGIKGAKRVVIPGGTHFLNLEKPSEFNEAVREFLNRE